jgi:phosphoribosylaminoimidazolecarboxamide formyltransferase/IMP cyclohydrolase
MCDFSADGPTFAILKHNNACGLASRKTICEAYNDALAGDPVSAFGGVLISNTEIDIETAHAMNDLFFEVLIAPSYSKDVLEILSTKKNRIILQQKPFSWPKTVLRSALNGILEEDRNDRSEIATDLTAQTENKPTTSEVDDLLFANKIVKHTKSNTIVLAKNKQLLGSGTGQTSRVDALKQAIAKANSFAFDLKGSVMASDAFFPFPDCVEIAHNEGITAVIQPGGSIKDQLSIDYCNSVGLKMVFTGTRHFKH